LTLGGGLGWLMSKHGLALDNLLSVELVTASGDVVARANGTTPISFGRFAGPVPILASRAGWNTDCTRSAESRAASWRIRSLRRGRSVASTGT
jgi:hypothetical protein